MGQSWLNHRYLRAPTGHTPTEHWQSSSSVHHLTSNSSTLFSTDSTGLVPHSHLTHGYLQCTRICRLLSQLHDVWRPVGRHTKLPMQPCSFQTSASYRLHSALRTNADHNGCSSNVSSEHWRAEASHPEGDRAKFSQSHLQISYVTGCDYVASTVRVDLSAFAWQKLC